MGLLQGFESRYEDQIKKFGSRKKKDGVDI